MPQVRNTPSRYVIELDAQELTLIGRGLAILAGLKVNTRGEDREAAAELNERLLYARLNRIRGEEKAVMDAIRRVEEAKLERSPEPAAASTGTGCP